MRPVVEGGRWEAAELAMAWGYPRRVTYREVECGAWYVTDDSIAWFVSPSLPPDLRVYIGEHTLAVHGISDPKRTCRSMTVRAMTTLEVLGELLGATKLYSLIPLETPGMPVKAMRRYLRRFGWREDDFGSYKLLGGD